jgi:hypothetical protein
MQRPGDQQADWPGETSPVRLRLPQAGAMQARGKCAAASLERATRFSAPGAPGTEG